MTTTQFVLARGRTLQSLAENTYLVTETGSNLVVEEVTISPGRVPIPMDLSAWEKTPRGFFTILVVCYDRKFG